MKTYTAMTPLEAEKKMREIARRLLDAIDEHAMALKEEAEAESAWEEAFLTAHTLSFAEHPDRTVSQHESEAKKIARPLRHEFLMARQRRRSLDHETHSLRQILSSLQTNARAMQGVS